MSYISPYKKFNFDGYSFDATTCIAEFHYSFDEEWAFTEKLQFEAPQVSYPADLFDRCLGLIFMLAGVSYYKCFPTKKANFKNSWISHLDADVLNAVYKNGLGQFIFENDLDPANLVQFESNKEPLPPIQYAGQGVVAMQSGGKDSVLMAQMLNDAHITYTPWYITTSGTFPHVIERAAHRPPRLVKRRIDRENLALAQTNGALNGHVPITFVSLAIALADAVLHGENVVMAAIGSEGNEAHAHVGDLPINHQWSKTWEAEELLTGYVMGTLSPQLHVGSPIRSLTELRIAELFVEKGWERFGHAFSSCNVANYRQAEANQTLRWCGKCAKCANAYLLFAPFVESADLQSLFGRKDLFADPELYQIFMGLLGVNNVIKPFECVGEVSELRLAYHMAMEKQPGKYHALPFEVSQSTFDYHHVGPQQMWTRSYIPEWMLERAN